MKHPAAKKRTIAELVDIPRRGGRIVMVTAYDASSARLADAAGVDMLLVGDSAAMTVLGHASTLPITLDEMVMLTSAVTRVTARAFVVADMPFGAYQAGDTQAVASAVRLVKDGGADAVKLEGAGRTCRRVRAIREAGIAVMGHVGLTPQSVTALSGYTARGRSAVEALAILDGARELERAGCFAVVLEAMAAPVAVRVSEALGVPTIGIGAGSSCDGQVLVWHDLLGITTGRLPRFVKSYASLAGTIQSALESYAADVRRGSFPAEEHTYGIPDRELAAFEAALAARTPEGSGRRHRGGSRARRSNHR